MEFRHLRYLVGVADHQHVGRAADALHIAKQALSVQIRDAERELGVALFARHPRGMALTNAGREFIAYAREALAVHARALEHVRRLGGDRPVLRVGVLEYGTPQLIGRRAARAFRARHPYADLRIDPTPYPYQPAAVRERRLEVGFFSGPLPDTEGVASEALYADALTHMLLPDDHPTAGRSVRGELGAVRGMSLATVPEADGGSAIRDMLAKVRRHGWRGRELLEPSPGRIAALVAAGVAWSVVPTSVCVAVPAGTAGVPLACGCVSGYDLSVVTGADETEEHGKDPLVAGFLACLREARDELVTEARTA